MSRECGALLPPRGVWSLFGGRVICHARFLHFLTDIFVSNSSTWVLPQFNPRKKSSFFHLHQECSDKVKVNKSVKTAIKRLVLQEVTVNHSLLLRPVVSTHLCHWSNLYDRYNNYHAANTRESVLIGPTIRPHDGMVA